MRVDKVMDLGYAITPFAAWLVAGCTKFIVNSIRARRLAFGLIGYGGLPSNHSAIVSSVTALIALREGIHSPAFGVALTLTFIVIMDAISLRGQVGAQAKVINSLAKGKQDFHPLRERIGHSRVEVSAGIFVGVIVATLIHCSQS